MSDECPMHLLTFTVTQKFPTTCDSQFAQYSHAKSNTRQRKMAPRKRVISRLFVSVSTALGRQRKSTGRHGLLCTKRARIFQLFPLSPPVPLEPHRKKRKCFSTKWSHCILPKSGANKERAENSFTRPANVHVCNR